jgi:hypothetical protein
VIVAWLQSNGLLLGSSHPDSVILTLRVLAVEQSNDANSPFYWDITASYSDEPLKPPQDSNPLNRAARIRMRSVRFQRPIIKDRDGNPITNSANEPFPPLEIENSHWSFEVEKNYPYNQIPSWVLTANDAINSDPFTISQLGLTIDTNCGKISELDLSDIQSEQVGDTTIYYRTLRFVIDFQQQGFQIEVADRGYTQLKKEGDGLPDFIADGAPCVINVKDSIGTLVKPTDPVYLDGSGGILDQASVDSLDFQYLTFDVYPEMDFSVLPLT